MEAVQCMSTYMHPLIAISDGAQAQPSIAPPLLVLGRICDQMLRGDGALRKLGTVKCLFWSILNLVTSNLIPNLIQEPPQTRCPGTKAARTRWVRPGLTCPRVTCSGTSALRVHTKPLTCWSGGEHVHPHMVHQKIDADVTKTASTGTKLVHTRQVRPGLTRPRLTSSSRSAPRIYREAADWLVGLL